MTDNTTAITLIRNAETAAGLWTQRTECYETLLEQMNESLGTEDEFSKRREFELIEVQVTRRAKIVREVTHSVKVEVTALPADTPAPVEEAAA